MRSDISRMTHLLTGDYRRVLAQLGRVVIDADADEADVSQKRRRSWALVLALAAVAIAAGWRLRRSSSA